MPRALLPLMASDLKVTIEAFIHLLIEITFIATFTHWFFAR